MAKVDWIVSNIKNNSLTNVIKPTPSSAPVDNEQQNVRVEFRSYSTGNVVLRLPVGFFRLYNIFFRRIYIL